MINYTSLAGLILAITLFMSIVTINDAVLAQENQNGNLHIAEFIADGEVVVFPDYFAKTKIVRDICYVTTLSRDGKSFYEKLWQANYVYPLDVKQESALLIVSQFNVISVMKVEGKKVVREWVVPSKEYRGSMLSNSALLIRGCDKALEPAFWKVPFDKIEVERFEGIPYTFSTENKESYTLTYGHFEKDKGISLYSDTHVLWKKDLPVWVARVSLSGGTVLAEHPEANGGNAKFKYIETSGKEHNIPIEGTGSIMLAISPNGNYGLLGVPGDFKLVSLPECKTIYAGKLQFESTTSSIYIDNDGQFTFWMLYWEGSPGTYNANYLISSGIKTFSKEGKCIWEETIWPALPNNTRYPWYWEADVVHLFSTNGYHSIHF